MVTFSFQIGDSFLPFYDLGVPLDATFTASAHCSEYSKAFAVYGPKILLCALNRPHLEYAMEANASTLRADINQL